MDAFSMEELRKSSYRLPFVPKDSLNDLCKCTKFTKKEIQIMYRTFKQDCPTGLLKEDTFREIFSRFFPNGNVSPYAHYVFRTFDSTQNESISFKDFLEWLSILNHGTPQDKLKWAFRLYDINRDGFIAKKEMSDIMFAVYALIGKKFSSVDERKFDVQVDRIFQKFESSNGMVSFEEFMNICIQDECIVKSLETLDTVL